MLPRVATFAVAVLTAACVGCPPCPSSLSGELAGVSCPGDLEPRVRSLKSPPRNHEAAMSRAAQQDLLCLTKSNPEKNKPEVSRRAGRRKTVKAEQGAFHFPVFYEDFGKLVCLW